VETTLASLQTAAAAAAAVSSLQHVTMTTKLRLHDHTAA